MFNVLQEGSAHVGVHLFHLTGVAATRHPTGSGDTALQYVFHLCLLTGALAGGVLWTIISELRHGARDYRTLYAWLRLGLRFTVGAILLVYGFEKFFPLQFPSPSLLTLTSTYGDSSPMKLLWTFMGASTAYTIFGGIAEIVPGLLLLFRRTSTLGALLASGVTLNVVLLNFCYDVPVKLFSTHLLLASLFLLLPDTAALWSLFFAGRAAALAELSLPPWQRRPLRWAAHVLQVLTLGAILYQSGLSAYREWKEVPAGNVPLRGVWVLDEVDQPALQGVWSKMVFDRPAALLIVQTDGERKWYDASINETAKQIDFPKSDKPSMLQWTKGADRALVLKGSWLGKPVTINLHKVDPDTFPLQTRGFHWIQEYPYNR